MMKASWSGIRISKVSITYNTWADHNNVVPAWAAAGTLPDIIYVHGSRATPWAHEGIIIDIHDIVTADEEFNVDGMWEESVRLYRVDGRIHALPYDHGPIILGYNKDMFDAAGMDYPSEDWTMEDMAAAAIELTDTPMPASGAGTAGSTWATAAGGFFTGAWGGVTMNEDETAMSVDTPEIRAALNHWYNLTHEENAGASGTEMEAFPNSQPFRAGVAAMGHIATWSTPSMRALANFEWDVAPTPMGADGSRYTGAFGSGYGITPTSDKPDTAWTYLREYLSARRHDLHVEPLGPRLAGAPGRLGSLVDLRPGAAQRALLPRSHVRLRRDWASIPITGGRPSQPDSEP